MGAIALLVLGFNLPVAPAQAAIRVDFRLASAPVTLQAVEVVGAVPVAVDTRTGDETFKIDQYHGAPVNTTSQIVQQSIAGAARAPTGEVHIRGQHAEYTYYVDGVPVPSGISGSLNELFDPTVTNNIDFKTGGWDAEYGGKLAAIIDVTTRIPVGGFHMDASGYGGSFAANGQSLSASTNSGKLGFFVSGARQVTDMRREPVVADTATGAPINFHNHGEDLFGFAKMQYTSGGADLLNIDANWSRTRFQVPYDSSGGAFLNDNQQDINGFVNLAWHHQFGAPGAAEADAPAELFAGGFYRHGSLTYTPGANDIAQFIFYPDTTTPYNLTEDRSFDTYGTKVDVTVRPQHGLMFKAGELASLTRGHEDFVTIAQDGTPGAASNSGLKGWDFGAYAEAAIAPSELFEIRPGVRFDAHNAPFAGTLTQVSPRIRLNFYPTPDAAAALKRFRGGEFDILSNSVAPQQTQWLKREVPRELRLTPFMATKYLVFNFERAPFDDLRVRKALSMAIDREILVSKITRGGETAAYSLVPPQMPGYPGQPHLRFRDQAMTARKTAAIELLREAGYGPNNPLDFALNLMMTTESKVVGVTMQEMWREIGVRPELIFSEGKVHYDLLRQQDFTIAWCAWSADYLDAKDFLFLAASTTKDLNFGRYRNPVLDRLLQQSDSEHDPALRAEMLEHAEQRMLDDEALAPVYYGVTRDLVSTEVHGWIDNPVDINRTRYLTLRRAMSTA